MKAIFVCEHPHQVARVYSEKTIAAIGKLVTLDLRVYSKAELLADPTPALDADFLFSTWGMPAFTKEEIAALFPRLQAVFYGAGSVQSFAREFLESGIAVHSAWAANAVPVAEYTVSQIVLANKGFYQALRRFKVEGHAAANDYCQAYPGTYDTTVGLIGIGMIGSMVAERLRDGYAVRVLAFDPFLPPERAEALGITLVDLPTLFEQSQTVSNHLANNPQTVGMLNYDLFSRMPQNAVFINTGRGAQVVEADLARALKEQPGRSAVLDVTFPEPPEQGHPFYSLDNVFLTPHIAGSLGQEVHRMSAYMLQELERRLSGVSPKYSVTLEMLKTMA